MLDVLRNSLFPLQGVSLYCVMCSHSPPFQYPPQFNGGNPLKQCCSFSFSVASQSVALPLFISQGLVAG